MTSFTCGEVMVVFLTEWGVGVSNNHRYRYGREQPPFVSCRPLTGMSPHPTPAHAQYSHYQVSMILILSYLCALPAPGQRVPSAVVLQLPTHLARYDLEARTDGVSDVSYRSVLKKP